MILKLSKLLLVAENTTSSFRCDPEIDVNEEGQSRDKSYKMALERQRSGRQAGISSGTQNKKLMMYS